MKISFEGYEVIKIHNPNAHCTEVIFESEEETNVPLKSIIFFEKQIKYIQVYNHKDYKRVKIYARGDEYPVKITFNEDNYDKFDLFLRSIYNS